MKIKELLEAETDKEKNRRHQKDLDDLERNLRKSKSLDKDTEAAIKARRMKLAKDRMSENTTAGSVASVATPVGGLVSRQMKNSDGTVKNALDMDTNIMGQKKKPKRKKA